MREPFLESGILLEGEENERTLFQPADRTSAHELKITSLIRDASAARANNLLFKLDLPTADDLSSYRTVV